MARVPNCGSPPAILLRESYREAGMVKNRTLANLSSWPEAKVDALARVLKGRPPPAAGLDGAFEITRSVPHGHVAAVLGTARALGLEELIDPMPSRQRDLVAAMAAAQVIAPDSKLAIARGLREETGAGSLGEVLHLSGCDEDDLYAAMDWLQERQEQIQDALATRHLAGGALVLYDVSSAAFEGRTAGTVRAITSLSVIQARPAGLARFARGHRGIEDPLHWIRDLTYDEDRSQVRTGNGPRVMASLSNLAIAILRLTGHASIAAALRYHARQHSSRCKRSCNANDDFAEALARTGTRGRPAKNERPLPRQGNTQYIIMSPGTARWLCPRAKVSLAASPFRPPRPRPAAAITPSHRRRQTPQPAHPFNRAPRPRPPITDGISRCTDSIVSVAFAGDARVAH